MYTWVLDKVLNKIVTISTYYNFLFFSQIISLIMVFSYWYFTIVQNRCNCEPHFFKIYNTRPRYLNVNAWVRKTITHSSRHLYFRLKQNSIAKIYPWILNIYCLYNIKARKIHSLVKHVKEL